MQSCVNSWVDAGISSQVKGLKLRKFLKYFPRKQYQKRLPFVKNPCSNFAIGCKEECKGVELEAHLEICRFHPCRSKVTNPNSCLWVGTRNSEEIHYKDDCEFATLNCPQRKDGCNCDLGMNERRITVFDCFVE